MPLNDNKKINCLCLGGPTGAKDKVFVSTGQRITGLSKKGKEFLKFNSNLTETIHTMFVEDVKMWTGGEFAYNMFENGKDVNFYTSTDRINALTVESITDDQQMDCILGCEDRVVRVIAGNDCAFEVSVGGSVNSLLTMKSADGSSKEGGKEIIYGTEDGRVGQLLLDPTAARRGWTLENKTQMSGVNCMHSYDITHDGVSDIVVGRDDGTIQVYSFDVSPEPMLQFEANVNESVRSIETGVVSSQDYDEIGECFI
jgi:Bardet-Biedl syndrome 7 protein